MLALGLRCSRSRSGSSPRRNSAYIPSTVYSLHAVDFRGALAAGAARHHRAAAGGAELRERPVGRARSEPADHLQHLRVLRGRRVRERAARMPSAAGTSCAPEPLKELGGTGSSPTGGCGRAGSTGSADTWMRRLRNDRSCVPRRRDPGGAALRQPGRLVDQARRAAPVHVSADGGRRTRRGPRSSGTTTIAAARPPRTSGTAWRG